MRRLFLLIAAFLPAAAAAEEGMWLFDAFPSAQVQAQHGFSPDAAFLDRIRLASMRIAGGCSASVVSPDGLVMTNHHCAHACIEQLSTAKRDFVATGFTAQTLADEVKCPQLELNQLVKITDVTERLATATRGLSGKPFNDAQKAEMSRLEKECATDAATRCDVVTLYRGGRYHLYQYRRFQDVRLVFAPEFAMAFFGGDPDNFMFPRYDLDAAFLRVWDGGKPAKTPAFLPFAREGVKDGDLVFVSGHPGTTNRLTPIAQLEVERDVTLPRRLIWAAELKGLLSRFSSESAEHQRTAKTTLFYVENSLKARKGRMRALQDQAFFATLAAREEALRAKVRADPKLEAEYGPAWLEVQRAMDRYRVLRDRHFHLEELRGFSSDLVPMARTLVRLAAEREKPNSTRLREFADSNLPALQQQLLGDVPVHADLEILTLGFGLSRMREDLGADDPFVKKVLGKRSPEELAAALVKGTRLGDVKVRRALFEGGAKAVAASTDPLIVLMRELDPDLRAVRRTYEDEVEAPLKKANELIARAHFAVHGTSTYPDATFTLRLSYGTVKGWTEPDGRQVAPLTTLGGAFERATGREPFRLPDSWIAAQAKLDPATPFNVATTNDIIGGNSGSPLINQRGEAVGLVFDGNIWSLAGDYAFDPAMNRCVAVHGSGLLHALDRIYGAKRLVGELRAAGGK